MLVRSSVNPRSGDDTRRVGNERSCDRYDSHSSPIAPGVDDADTVHGRADFLYHAHTGNDHPRHHRRAERMPIHIDFLPTRSGRRVLLRATGLTRPSPTIVVVHGYTGTPTGIETYAELTARANASGIAVAYPEGSPTPNGGLGWNSGVLATELVNDLTVLRDMIDVMVMTGSVDPAQIILTGESNGAAMALVAACAPPLATRFTRLVLVTPPSIPACYNAVRRDRSSAPHGGRWSPRRDDAT